MHAPLPNMPEPELKNEHHWKFVPYIVLFLAIYMIVILFALGKLVGIPWLPWVLLLPCLLGFYHATAHMLYNHFLEENPEQTNVGH